MYFSKSGSSKAIRRYKFYAERRKDLIDVDEFYVKNLEKTKKEKQLNEKWLKELIDELLIELTNEPEVISRLERKLFSYWRKNHYCNKYTLAHVHIFRECEGISAEIAIRIENIVLNSYKKYEQETGENVRLISRLTSNSCLEVCKVNG